MITVNLTYDVVTAPPVTPAPAQLTGAELWADHIYYMANSYKKGTAIQAQLGDQVGEIPSLKGGLSLFWNGAETTAISGGACLLSADGLEFENVPYSGYLSNAFTARSFPYEVTAAGILLPGQPYEQYFNSWESNDMIGDNGSEMRIMDTVIPGSASPDKFKVFVMHGLFDTNSAKLWINGVLQGTISHSQTGRSRTRHSLGVDTNNVNWKAKALYIKHGKYSDSDRTTFLSTLGSLWGQGIEVQKPYAYNVSQTYNSGTQTWSVSFSTKNPSGGGINLLSTRYKWYLNKRPTGSGSFDNQTLVGTGATLNKSAYSSLLTNFTGTHYLICYVEAVDNAGNGWKPICGGYTEGS